MELYREILGEQGWQTLAALAKLPLAQEFYLAGGTALALQLGHRKSFDLDFFTKTPGEKISASRIERFLSKVESREEPRLIQRAVDQATWDILGTRVTFLAYPFPLMEPCIDGETTIAPEMRGIALATASEIALMKAYTIGRRAAFRDYVDMYYVLKSQAVTLDYILEHAPIKFTLQGESVFSPKLFLEQMVYTVDAPDRVQALNLVLGETLTAQDVEAFLQDEVRSVVRSVEVREWRRKR